MADGQYGCEDQKPRKWMGKSKKRHKKHQKGTFIFLKKERKRAKNEDFVQIVK